MFILKLVRCFFMTLVVASLSLTARDVLLEFKGAAFFPTNSCFKAIYHKSGALYGPELTVQMCDDNEHWYGFASVDFYSKKGCSIGLNSPTKVNLVPLAFGLKYFIPFCYGNFYLGLGVQPVHVKTKDCLPDAIQYISKWGVGGIAKVGTYIDVPDIFCCDCCSDLFLDLFVDYSFAKIGCEKLCVGTTNGVIPIKANVSGAIVGAGLGYTF